VHGLNLSGKILLIYKFKGMKKLILSIAIVSFVAFGAISIQNITAATSHVEVVRFDKDPKKVSEKKSSDTKEVKTDAKAIKSEPKSSSASSADKSSSTKSSCDGCGDCCSHSCPDKK